MSEPLQKGILSFLQLDGTPQTLAGATRIYETGKGAPFKPQTVLFRWGGLRGETDSGASQTLVVSSSSSLSSNWDDGQETILLDGLPVPKRWLEANRLARGRT